MTNIYAMEDRCNAARAKCGLPYRRFAGTSKQAVQVMINRYEALAKRNPDFVTRPHLEAIQVPADEVEAILRYAKGPHWGK